MYVRKGENMRESIYISGKRRKSMLTFVETENDLLAVVETKNNC